MLDLSDRFNHSECRLGEMREVCKLAVQADRIKEYVILLNEFGGRGLIKSGGLILGAFLEELEEQHMYSVSTRPSIYYTSPFHSSNTHHAPFKSSSIQPTMTPCSRLLINHRFAPSQPFLKRAK